jgi:hypothetical protein
MLKTESYGIPEKHSFMRMTVPIQNGPLVIAIYRAGFLV